MAVHIGFAVRSWCRLARSEQCAANPRSIVSRFRVDRTTRPLLGLLALPCIFSAASLNFCCCPRNGCRRGLDSFFTAGSLVFGANLLCRSLVKERAPPCLRRNNFFRCSAESVRGECGSLRYWE